MTTTSDLLATAVEHHQRGELQKAAEIYSRVLQMQPDHADALHLSGLIESQQGRHDVAIDTISRAIAVRPNAAAFHHNLGGAYTSLRRFPEAVASYRKALELQPDLVDAQRNLADVLYEMGRTEDARACYEQYLGLATNDAEGHNNLGNVLRDLGQLEEAIASYQKALELNSQLTETWVNLGISFRDQKLLKESVNCFLRALELTPDHAGAHHHLGVSYYQLGKSQESIAEYERAIELKPSSSESYHTLGIAFHDQWLFDEAVSCYRKALGLTPDNARIHNSLGNALRSLWELDEAAVCFERALALDPGYAKACNNLGNTYLDQAKVAEAVHCFRHALELDPQLAEADSGLGMAYRERGQLEQAVSCFQRALELKPELAEAHYNLGNTRKDLGQFPAAVECFQKSLELDPRFVPAMAGLATIQRDQLSPEVLTTLEQMADTPALPPPQFKMVQFALAQVYDAQSNYPRAAEHLELANEAQQRIQVLRGKVYQPVDFQNYVSKLIEAFHADYFSRVANWGDATEKPVFVVGMPRSGTTLVEQILASHPSVYGAGERFFTALGLEQLPAKLQLSLPPLDCLPHLTAKAVAESAQWHLGLLNEVAGSGPLRIVDKLPDNYQLLGWIATLFPHARIIHCRRDMRDVALSCWITNFDRVPWSSNLEHLADRILDYQRMMNHYETVLPKNIYSVHYEDLVHDQEAVSRKLIDFVGLDWDPACLEFYRTEREIRTASVTQVRQPIYSSSIGRWKHYATALAPLLQRLENAR